jgi:hypothetical protein
VPGEYDALSLLILRAWARVSVEACETGRYRGELLAVSYR